MVIIEIKNDQTFYKELCSRKRRTIIPQKVLIKKSKWVGCLMQIKPDQTAGLSLIGCLIQLQLMPQDIRKLIGTSINFRSSLFPKIKKYETNYSTQPYYQFGELRMALGVVHLPLTSWFFAFNPELSITCEQSLLGFN